MKESGINYFFGEVGGDTGEFAVFYTFENGAGLTVDSVPLGQAQFAGTLSSEGDFWVKPGSGFFSGNYITVSDASGLYSQSFTHVFSFEKVSSAGGVLMSNLNGSGYEIGLTDSNRLYFRAFNEQPIIAASYTNLSRKNLVSVSYSTDNVSLGYYDFNSQQFTSESFNAPFGDLRSDHWVIGPSYTGYMDYYAYFAAPYGTSVLDQLASGFYNTPTGSGYSVQTICTTGITGYEDTLYLVTGITGYTSTGIGDGGDNGFGGAFPSGSLSIGLTGIISSGIVPTGLTGMTCQEYTGVLTVYFDTNLGYASGFGMERVLILRHIESGDILKYSQSELFSPHFNLSPAYLFSGYAMGANYGTGEVNLYVNGVYAAPSSFTTTGQYLYIYEASSQDIITYDIASGTRLSLETGVDFTYTGQEVYLNGINLISGYDFVIQAGSFLLTGNNTGISGVILTSPFGLAYATGAEQLHSTQIYARNTSNIYLNGVRQQLDEDFIEGSIGDKLIGNSFDENGNLHVYNDSEQFWE